MKKKKILIMFLVVLIASIYSEKLKVAPMEEISIVAGIGYDIYKDLKDNVQYSIPLSIYDFKKKGVEGIGITSENGN